MQLEIKGLDEVRDRLESLGLTIQAKIGAALRAEGELVMTEAKRRTPVDTGALRASGLVTGPKKSGTETAVRLSFGNNAVQYAIPVHERLGISHKVGRAKYLESAFNEAFAGMAARIADRIKV